MAEERLTVEAAGNSTEQDVIETRTARIWLGEDGILRSIVKKGVDVTLTDAKDVLAAGVRIAGGRRVPVLVVASGVRSVNREARNHFGGEAAANLMLAQALRVDSPVSRVIGNFFLGLNKTSFPTRLFTSEAEALEWLKGFIA